MTDVAMRHSTFEYTLTPPPGRQEKDQAVLTQHAELRPDPAQALPCIIYIYESKSYDTPRTVFTN